VYNLAWANAASIKVKEGNIYKWGVLFTRYEAEAGAHVPLSKHLAPPWSPVWHAPWPGPLVVGAVEQIKRSVRAGGLKMKYEYSIYLQILSKIMSLVFCVEKKEQNVMEIFFLLSL